MTASIPTKLPAMKKPPSIERPLGHTAARGLAWSLGQSVLVKIVNFGGQIALSWLLLTTDYGFIGLALSVASFTALIQQAGIRDVLVQRGRHFKLWAGPAFVLSLFTATLGAILLVASAPVVAGFYHEPRLEGLIFVLAIAGFLNCFTLVPFAKLQIDLRFRAIAVLALVTSSFSMATSIVLAWLGSGAYSFVIPMPLTSLVFLGILWPLVRPNIRSGSPLRRTRFLFGDNLLLLGATFFLCVTTQGDYIILGRMYPKEVVGLYFWAFNISLQSLTLLAETLSNVLFPSLSRLQAEPERQHAAFVRATRAIALVGIPACFAQAALAEPIVKLMFNPRWYPAIPILQVLSIGMAFQVIERPAFSTLKARGQFGLLLILTSSYAAAFVGLVIIGSFYGAGVGAATAVAVFSCIAALASTHAALRGAENPWLTAWSMHFPPLAAGLLAGGAAFLVVRHLPTSTRAQCVMSLAIGAGVMACVFLPLAKWWASEAWGELTTRLKSLLSRSIAPVPVMLAESAEFESSPMPGAVGSDFRQRP
jgi:PST family polysaccharide transporter